jgi:hypothetical protein
MAQSDVKFLGSTWGLRLILGCLSGEEGRGIPSVEVKFVDIGKNTGGEGGDLVLD